MSSISLIEKQELVNYINQTVPEKRTFLKKVFLEYLDVMLNKSAVVDKLEEAAKIYSIFSNNVTSFVKYDNRIGKLNIEGAKQFLSSALQFNDIGFYGFLYNYYFPNVTFEYLTNGGHVVGEEEDTNLYSDTTTLGSFLKTDADITFFSDYSTKMEIADYTDELELQYSDSSLITDSLEIYMLAAIIEVTLANRSNVRDHFTDMFKLLLSITKSARLFVSTIFLVRLRSKSDLTAYGTLIKDRFASSTWDEVQPWIGTIDTIVVTDWRGVERLQRPRIKQVISNGKVTIRYRIFWTGVKAITVRGWEDNEIMSFFEFQFSSDFYIESEFYRNESCWEVEVSFNL